ncbi:MAG: glycosyltransferase family 61 protein [Melioribacteraceae bacterium]|nr:glycosyltransferase family 61 protein [Melioribacteraceae bacterium]MCF8264419.1 glycosyltransferase family 61 protein [Melioribacteraceae bacterium]
MTQYRNKLSTRMKKTIQVFLNQLEILKASKLNRQIFLNPIPPGGRGHVEHYYHFIFDLLLPLNTLIKKTPPNTVFLLEHFGIFTNRVLDLFPGRIQIVDKNDVPKETKRINLIGINPLRVLLTSKFLESFVDDMFNNFGIEKTDKAKKILLIERLPPDRYFIEDAKRKGGGSTRRSILNHHELSTTLQSMVKAPFEFHNLQLENLSFRDQIEIFSKAKVVIAQHGAGLANCIWMNPKSIMVELSSELHYLHFERAGKLKRHDYNVYEIPDRHAKIDIEDFTNRLLENEQLGSYFEPVGKK